MLLDLIQIFGGIILGGSTAAAVARHTVQRRRATHWAVPRLTHDETIPVGPRIHGGLIRRAAGEADRRTTKGA